MKVLVLHAYSALNAGDGLLVEECLDVVREALGPDTDITLAASDPDSFRALGVRVVGSKPTLRGYSVEYLSTLRHVRRFDVVVAVGGGYQRAGHPLEAVKAGLVHGPQLLAASRRGRGVVYLPQSIGPLRGGVGVPVRAALRRIERVFVRDDRSIAELPGTGVVRAPDLALVASTWSPRAGEPDPVPVLSVRAVRGAVPADVHRLAAELGVFDGYVQSTVGGNDDTTAMAVMAARRTIPRSELLDTSSRPRRVVVAMRLHGALMALRAGHLVVHLAYERKGFGAFDDLGLASYVHNSFGFDARRVRSQVDELLHDSAVRDTYDATVAASRARFADERRAIVGSVREAAGVVQR